MSVRSDRDGVSVRSEGRAPKTKMEVDRGDI